MHLKDILALAKSDAPKAWGPLNAWLSRNFLRASDRDLARALAAQHDLSRHISH